MRHSKAVDIPETKHSKFYWWWIDTDLYSWYRDFTYKFFKKPIHQIKKLYGWQVNVFQTDFDFDGHSLFAIIEYKLKRVKVALDKGYAVQDSKDMKALKLAIKLSGRLKEENYSESFFDRHEKKWGKAKYWFEPCSDGTTNSYRRNSRPNANTDEEKEQERKEFLACSYGSEAKMEREMKWLFDILRNHLRSWWD